MLLICADYAFAQYDYEMRIDTIPSFRQSLEIDTLLMGRNIYDLLNEKGIISGRVKITQSGTLTKAMRQHSTDNASKRINGYRVRIYFDNSQNARYQSERILERFAEEYPNIRVYRSHVSPYFKVTVGDFRTRGDAYMLADKLKSSYPAAFIVKETINYPSF